jgi:hypothetical protein
VWIEENTQHPIDAAVSIALLETAFDRYIDLLGATDAFEQTGRSLLSAKGRKVSQVAAITRLSRQIETRYETRGAMWQLKRRPGIRIQLLASPPFPYDFGQIVCGDPL